MLTKDILIQNEALKGLTEEQITALETLSRNDEGKVIGDKVRSLHEAYEADIEAATGQKKPDGWKSAKGTSHTYEWLREALLPDLVKKASGEETKKEIEALKAANAALEMKIKEGAADGHLKEKVAGMEKEKADLANRITELQGKLEKEKGEWKKEAESLQAQLKGKDIEFEFQRHLAGMKFKDEKFIPAQVRDTYIQAAKAAILARATPDHIDNGAGGQVLAFRDKATGQVLNNPENGLNPFTAGELLKKELAPILDAGQQQNGAGTGGGSGAPADLVLSISGAGSQVKADEMIQAHLMARGMQRGTPEFSAEMKKIRDENGVAKLPLR